MKKIVIILMIIAGVSAGITADNFLCGGMVSAELVDKDSAELQAQFSEQENLFSGFYWEMMFRHFGMGNSYQVKFDQTPGELAGLENEWRISWIGSFDFRYHLFRHFLLDPYLDPGFYHEMMDYFGQRMFEVIKQYKNSGADMVSCGGNVAAGGVVGPDYFAEHILPSEKAFFKKINETGLYSIYHNCGDASHLLPLYPQIGMRMYESLTPAPYGDTDLEYALGVMPSNITLSGGFDQISLLRYGSTQEIRQTVKKMMETVKRRGNFIMAATDYFNENTPEEKVFEFAKAAKEFGEY